MTQRQRARKERALAGKPEIINQLNAKIAEFTKHAKESGRTDSMDYQEHAAFLQKKKAKHEQEAETLRQRLAGAIK